MWLCHCGVACIIVLVVKRSMCACIHTCRIYLSDPEGFATHVRPLSQRHSLPAVLSTVPSMGPIVQTPESCLPPWCHHLFTTKEGYESGIVRFSCSSHPRFSSSLLFRANNLSVYMPVYVPVYFVL